MNITRHLYLSTAVRSPDEPAAPEPEVIEPVAEVAPEPAPEVQPAPEPEPAPAPQPEAPHGNSGKTPWYMKEIAQTREEKRQNASRADAAEQRAADLQAIIDRMQADPTAPPPAARSAAPAERAAPAGDFQAAVKAQAARDRFIEDTVSVRDAGLKDFPDSFTQSLDILAAVGATTNDDFVADILAVDKSGAHIIIDKLAKDPEKAAALVGMDSRRRIAELTRMADAPKTEVKPAAPAAPAAPAISRAPAPRPSANPIAPAVEVDPTTPDGNDKMDDKAWEAWYKGKDQKRA